MRTVRADRQRTTEAIFGIWSLFAALTLLMLGNGLQGSLVGVNTQSLGFSSLVTAVVMASYFVGFLGGSFAVPKLVLRVGHVRVFASLASAASVAALAYSISGDPVTWGVMRFITGACFAGLYVVAESWIHSRATNAARGRLMAIYMVIVLGAAGVGQLLLNVSDPAGFELFVLSSVLISLAVVPVSLARSPMPDFEFESRSGLGDLVRRSPLGVVAGVLTGAANAAILGMGAVYGVVAGMTTFQITVFMASTLAGGVALQWPLGLLSDRTSSSVQLRRSSSSQVSAPSQAPLLYPGRSASSAMRVSGGVSVRSTRRLPHSRSTE